LLAAQTWQDHRQRRIVRHPQETERHLSYAVRIAMLAADFQVRETLGDEIGDGRGGVDHRETVSRRAWLAKAGAPEDA
jgi:hypothetical protein